MDIIMADRSQWAVDLVKRIQAGDRDAEAEFVEQYTRPLKIFAKQQAHAASVIEDVCQETFRIAIEKLRQGEIHKPEKLTAFVLGIARKKARRFSERAERFVNDDHNRLAATLPDAKPSPLDELLRREEAAIVRKVIGQLSLARDREVIIRFYLHEEDKNQICADLGLRSAQFDLVLHRARERFAELYEQRVGERT